MAIDSIKTSGTRTEYKDDRGGAVLISTPVIGIVKDNIDPTHNGRIKVYVAKFPGNDPDNSKTWLMVKYLSPFFGTISPNYDVYKGPFPSGPGEYKGNPHSYGFWGTAPDIGSQVVCIFINGDPQDGYYIGGSPLPGLNHMVPAIGSNKNVKPNAEEATLYSGATKLPVTEINYTDKKNRNNVNWYDITKPVHSYQAAILSRQGLIRDNLRGTISSSAQRESPSKVFGWSTPGGPIYEGGYTNQTIKQAAKSASDTQLKVIGRTGGHSLVMDDGTYDGKDQLIRIRTAGGHMLMMNDTGQVMTIMHSNGQSYIEFGKEGTIDMYSTNSVNVRTNGDINFHADRDINLHAERNLNMFADNIAVESAKGTTVRTGADFEQYTLGKYTVKVDQQMSLFSLGNASFASFAITYINGLVIHLNTGRTSTIPQVVPAIPKVKHVDTIWSNTVGWMNPSPDPLLSIGTRAPAHMPWAAANKGVDAIVSISQGAAPSQPTANVQAANQSAGSTTNNPTSPAVAATAPTLNVKSTENKTVELPPETVTAMASQSAVNAASSTVEEKIEKGLVPGIAGVTYNQMSQPGQSMKPGSGDFAAQLQQLAPDLPMSKIAGPNLMTGAFGVNSAADLASNSTAQLNAFAGSVKSSTKSFVQNGLLTGSETPTQAAGLIMAGVTEGVEKTTESLTNIGNLASVGGSAVGKAMSAGTFAASMADKFNSGNLGVANSLSALSNNTLGALSSGLSNTTTPGGINGITSSLAGSSRSAFLVAEQSFGKMLPNEPNILGGLDITESPGSLINNLQQSNGMISSLKNVQQQLSDAEKIYRLNPSIENLEALRTAENLKSSTEQKLEQLKQSTLAESLSLNQQTGNNPFSSTSAQNLNTIAAAAQSGQLFAPNPNNTGINALPGGLSAFANTVSSAASNTLSTVKNFDSVLSEKLADPAALAGNLVNNVKSALTTQISPENITNNLTSTFNNAQSAASALTASANSAIAGITSGISAQMSSLGNGPAQIKPPVLATETFTTAPVITSKLASAIDDPAVPTPVFNETSTESDPDSIKEQQKVLQKNLERLYAKRDEKNYELQKIVVIYDETDDVTLIPKINQLQAEITKIDQEIIIAQDAYDKLIGGA